MTYQPQPIDTTHIALTPEHLYLARLLAENSHAQWSQSLLDVGWCFGAQLNPAARTHPYLIPFGDLPEPVKEERLQVFLDYLKLTLALGYRLETPQESQAVPPSPVASPPLPTASAPDLTLNLPSLMALRRDIVKVQPRTPELHCALGDTLMQLGEPLIAYDVLMDGLRQWPQSLRLHQLLALALARSGSTLAANQLLLQLVEQGQRDEQTLGILARTHKDLWRQATEPDLRQQQLQLAATRYFEAYQEGKSLWTGVNAATMAMLSGNWEQARALAIALQEVGQRQLEETVKTGQDPYWALATLGEVELLLQNWDTAKNYYAEAAAYGQGRFGDLCSSYRNGALLIESFGNDPHQLKEWLKMPAVVVFCGHRIDAPDRPIPRFPPELERPVYEAIQGRLQQIRGHVGYASAANGSDILFLEAILSMGGECTVVLPYNREDFLRESVAREDGSHWTGRFEQVLSQAREVVIASDSRPVGDALTYEYANRMLHGLARIRAQQLQTELVPLAVWNGQPGDGLGGTASTVNHWRQWAEQVEIIDLAQLLQTHTQITLPVAMVPCVPASPTPPSDGESVQREIRALLFADVVHYTQLTDIQLRAFMEHFLSAIANLSADPSHTPLTQNTWGDALYCVFATVREAGLFALNLCEQMRSIQWAEAGLPIDLNARIALHAGPVYRNIDLVTGQVNYIGTHVNHAARIEPITPPGKVYASQAFAAIAASEKVSDFTCDYVGRMPWAKHYGTFPTYHVHGITAQPT